MLALSLTLTPVTLSAVELNHTSLGKNVVDLTGEALILHDQHYQYTAEQALAKLSAQGFTSDPLDTNGKHYWFYLPVFNTTHVSKWSLSSNNTLVDDFNYYWRCGQQPLKKLERPKIGFSSESIATSYYTKLTVPKGQPCGFLQEVSVVTVYPLQNYLMPTSLATQRSNFQTIVCAIAFGVIIGLLIYNLLLSASLLSLNYLLYSIYALVNLSCLVLITFRPFSAYYELIPSMNWFRITGASANMLFIIFTIRFMRPALEQADSDNLQSIFLAASKTLIRWRFLPYAVMFFFIAEAFVSPGTFGITGRYYPILLIVCSFYIPILSLTIALTGYRPAYVFLIAWTILMGGNISGILDLIGAIELNGWARTIAIVGAALEMILLSIALAMNMRESQKAEDRAQRAREKAEGLMHRQDKFVSTLSHEIRTPLHAILGATNLLAKTELNAQQKELWGSTHYAAESMHALVDNMLDRADAKNTSDLEQTSHFDPNRLLDAMVQLLKPRALEKNLNINLVTQSIPSVLEGNPLVIRRLLINLISNSIKYTDQGEITVFVEWHAKQNRLQLRIKDTGRGMSKTQLNQLNQRFNKDLESLYSEDSSSGLGLAICNEMLLASGGKWSIDSAPNQGTTVTVDLSLLEVNLSQTPADPLSPKHHGEPAIHENLIARVLIVDDIASNRLIAEEIIKQTGCTTITANNGRQALEILQHTHIDVLISDLRMPEMGGEQLLTELQSREYRHLEPPQIIITSAHLNTAKQKELMAMGATICLAKPYPPEELATQVTNLVNDPSKHPHNTLNMAEHQTNDAANTPIATSVANHLGRKVYTEVVALFRQQTTQDLNTIKHGLRDHNTKAISVAAHRIVSASKALGFSQLADTATSIESHCLNTSEHLNNDAQHTVQRLLSQLEADFKHLNTH